MHLEPLVAVEGNTHVPFERACVVFYQYIPAATVLCVMPIQCRSLRLVVQTAGMSAAVLSSFIAAL